MRRGINLGVPLLFFQKSHENKKPGRKARSLKLTFTVIIFIISTFPNFIMAV